MKKRQGDFQKTKLRVGKSLPKGANVTDTSFKTKKIIKPDQSKAFSGPSSLKDLLKLLSHNNVSTKRETLNKLNHLITSEHEILYLHFPALLRQLGSVLMENDFKVRTYAITVMNSCLNLLSDSQINCFFKELTSYLHCMMTHLDISIRKDSLSVLDTFLKSHPTIFCQSMKILHSMLNMISSFVHPSGQERGRKKRKLDEIISSNILSQDWRASVLQQVKTFVDANLAAVKKNNKNGEEAVFVDGEREIYVPLYLGGGLKPAVIETLEDSSKLKDKNTLKEFRSFVYELIPLLSEIIKGEKPGSNLSQGSNLFSEAAVSRIRIAAQLLCSLGELIHFMDNDEKDSELNHMISSIICSQFLKDFPYSQFPVNSNKKTAKRESESMQLNLAVCYLYSMFILDSEYSTVESESYILSYLEKIYRVPGTMSPESVTLTLKSSKCFIASDQVQGSYKSGILLALYNILEANRFKMAEEELMSFFMELSLDYNQRSLACSDCDGMKIWYRMILKELTFMKTEGKKNIKFLKYVQKLCAIKPQHFMNFLNETTRSYDEILGLLATPDSDFQLTAIHLILCVSELDNEFLRAITCILHESYFSLRNVNAFLHLLHIRFSANMDDTQSKIDFVRFLLNLACDSVAIVSNPDPNAEREVPEVVMKAMELCQFEIYPPKNLDRQKNIFQMCFKYLNIYFKDGNLIRCAVLFLKSLLVYASRFPMQCVLPLITLSREVLNMYHDLQIRDFLGEILFTCYVYLSFLHYENNAEHMRYCAVAHLQDGLRMTDGDIEALLSIIACNYFNLGHSELYHILRILLFLINTGCLGPHNGELCDVLLKKMAGECQSSDILRPFFYKVCSCINMKLVH